MKLEDNDYWNIGAVTLIGADTILTQLAVGAGEAFELNPIMRYTIEVYGFAEVAVAKGIAILIIYGMWRAANWEEDRFNQILKKGFPRGIAVIGVVITILNGIQVIMMYTL